jgi:hypothetical protein
MLTLFSVINMLLILAVNDLVFASLARIFQKWKG